MLHPFLGFVVGLLTSLLVHHALEEEDHKRLPGAARKRCPRGVLYHVTYARNVRQIKQHGLQPHTPQDMVDAQAVYLFRTVQDAENAICGWLGDRLSNEDEPLALLAIDGAQIEGTVTPGFEVEVTTQRPVPPSAIKVMSMDF